jgi:hypothetical protein
MMPLDRAPLAVAVLAPVARSEARKRAKQRMSFDRVKPFAEAITGAHGSHAKLGSVA